MYVIPATQGSSSSSKLIQCNLSVLYRNQQNIYWYIMPTPDLSILPHSKSLTGKHRIKGVVVQLSIGLINWIIIHSFVYLFNDVFYIYFQSYQYEFSGLQKQRAQMVCNTQQAAPTLRYICVYLLVYIYLFPNIIRQWEWIICLTRNEWGYIMHSLR